MIPVLIAMAVATGAIASSPQIEPNTLESTSESEYHDEHISLEVHDSTGSMDLPKVSLSTPDNNETLGVLESDSNVAGILESSTSEVQSVEDLVPSANHRSSGNVFIFNGPSQLYFSNKSSESQSKIDLE